MKLGLMQPYFLPYIGYFQLIGAVDLFVVYDNIEYTKKGWINRNRLCRNGQAVTFSLPLKHAPDNCNVYERELAPEFRRHKLLNTISAAYRGAPYFSQTFSLIETIILHDENNLFRFLDNCLRRTCDHLGVTTRIEPSSSIKIDHALKKQYKVLEMCEAVGADMYLNTIGGMELYSREDFHRRGIDLKFIRTKPFEYTQFGNAFVPMLSIMDVMMFNSLPEVQSLVNKGYELI